MALIVTYATALALGSLHALETDHMAAVMSFAVRRPGPRAAVRFGLRWALGHGSAIVMLGGALVLLGIQLPSAATHWLEQLVGLTMIGLGVWALTGARALHAHQHAHDDGVVHVHVHSHARAADHGHGHAVTAVGLLHGLAGSGAAVALIPLVGLESPAGAVLYLVVFAVGTMGAMSLYALLAGLVVGRTARGSVRLARVLARVTGGFTVAIGLLWLVR